MSYKSSNYVPKKNKINWLKVLIAFVLVIGIFTLLEALRSYETREEINYYGVCGYNDRQTRELIDENNIEETLKISDYLFYGETLNIYQNPYQLGVSDTLTSKTIILNNLCTQDEYLYILEKQVDGQIPLEDLEAGFYSVSILEDIDNYQLYFENAVLDEFYTVTRDGTNKKITIQADKTMFNNIDDSQDYLDQNYLYLKVEEEQPPVEVVDIIIDPGHFSNDAGNYVEKGISINGRTEAEETYRIAELLADKLSDLGFSVLITRNSSTDIVDSYDINGRLYKGYQASAKYYIDIQMRSSTNSSIRGTQIVYSSYSSNRFAQTVLNEIVNNTSLISSGVGEIAGVVEGGLLEGYDGRMMLRESGGRILGAGTFSEKAEEENGSFAKDSRFGMQAITIEYGYMSNSEDMQIWDSELNAIAEQTAQGIARYLGTVK